MTAAASDRSHLPCTDHNIEISLLQAAGGPGGMPGAPPGLPGGGLPGMPGLPPGMPGLPPASAAGLLSLAGHPGLPGLPPSSLAQMMGHRDMKDEKSGLAAMEERLKHSSSASPASR